MDFQFKENKTKDLGDFLLGFLKNINNPEPYIKESIDNFIKNSDFEFLKDINDKIDKLNKKLSSFDNKDDSESKNFKEANDKKDLELRNIKEDNDKEDSGFKKVDKPVRTIDTRFLKNVLI